MNSYTTAFDGTMDAVKAAIRAFITPMEAFLKVFSNFWVGGAFIIFVFGLFLTINIIRSGPQFSKDIKKAQTLSFCALMIALNVILGYFSCDITGYIRVGFGFITLPVVATFYGPLVGCIAGLMQDLVSFILKPTGGYLFTLTLNVGISGMIYGLMLYNKKITFWRVLLSKVIIIVFVNIILNSVALSPTVGSGLVGILPSRIIKNVLLLPIQTVIVYILLKGIKSRIKVRK